jgi:hypothetical protein
MSAPAPTELLGLLPPGTRPVVRRHTWDYLPARNVIVS